MPLTMIDIHVRIHDRYSVEFKVGYVVRKELEENNFVMNTWLFIPSGLEINSFTYSKNQFYRDVTSSIRLITPIYELAEVADLRSLPFMFLEGAFNELVIEPNTENLAEYEYQIKMFTSIVRSALRKETKQILSIGDISAQADRIFLYIRDVNKIISKYRELDTTFHHKDIPPAALNYFSFGDEFLSNLSESYAYRLLEGLKRKSPRNYTNFETLLIDVVHKELNYKTSKGFQIIQKKSPDNNRGVVFRMRLLKKYVESHLVLNANKKKDGRLAEQVYYSIAAGLSMIFATGIAFSFQQKYGNFTMPLFVVLVVSYMLKDRIKELTRFYFVHRLAMKYFDNKNAISIKDKPIGWIKEGVDFITEERVPDEVMEIRNRSDLLEADNRSTQEKIILYRKLVRIDGRALDESNQYDIVGINDIFRFNVSYFLLKMDNPDLPLAVPSSSGGYEIVNGERVYYLNFLLQFQNDGHVNYKRFRLIMSRNGIEGIEKL